MLPACPADVGTASTFALRMLSGRLSLLPPQSDDGARARTEASVSMERRRRRLLDDASVRIDALSVSRLLAVAVLYVVGGAVGARCEGMADAGDVAAGKGWLNWIDCAVLLVGAGAGAARDWIVVKVVASDCTEGAGLEKVLSPPRLNSVPPPVVRAVPVSELAP